MRRAYLFILYLNAPWRAEWGGKLRVFEGEEGAASGVAGDCGSTPEEEGARRRDSPEGAEGGPF